MNKNLIYFDKFVLSSVICFFNIICLYFLNVSYIYMLYCHLLIHAEIYIYILDTYWRNDNRRRKTSLTVFTSHFIARVRKGCVGFYCERELEIEHNCNILTPNLWPSALCLSCSPGLLNRRPRAHSAEW